MMIILKKLIITLLVITTLNSVLISAESEAIGKCPMACPKILRYCEPNENPKSSCCPCTVRPKPDCSTVRCAMPKCPAYQHAVTLQGSCCPSCQPCTGIACTMQIKLCNTSIGETPSGCCPCTMPPKPDCSTVRCAMPKCPAYQHAITLEGNCCPTCQPCTGIACTLQIKYCNTSIGETPSGCCPCTMPEKPDCSLVDCAKPKVCPPYQRLVTPEGSCCPSCQPCTDIACPAVVRYCQPPEVPTGCCPCTPQE